ncbi:hypothetical protein IDM40_04385 [Nocardiopsis sp. HNM0947]|uniref:Uncharacterized protein n=1 Tax=Nocardiopsis coralli TaxID=2772213 RepID=A0ABR9P2G9_9ACTN|nr:hypothetical protein [Nocardiopsis coralli]MBE2997950.1 hypothetical protein [Nocardiopsis coralli]
MTTHSDGTGDVSINGRAQTVSAETAPEVRTRVTEIITDVAGKLGRPVKVATSGVDGEWPLVVHPDGTVEEDSSAPAPKKGRKAKSRKPRAGADPSGGPGTTESTNGRVAEPVAPEVAVPEPEVVSEPEAVPDLATVPEPVAAPEPEAETGPEAAEPGPVPVEPEPRPAPAVPEAPSGAAEDPRFLPHEAVPGSAPALRSPEDTAQPVLPPDRSVQHTPPGQPGQQRFAGGGGHVPTPAAATDDARARAAQWWGEAIDEHNRSVGARAVATVNPQHSNGSDDRPARRRRFFSRRGPEN